MWEPGTVAFLIVAAAALCGFICAAVAHDKGRSGAGWFILGIFFGPIALLAVAMVSPTRREPAVQTESLADEIERLNALRAAGALTTAEFEAAKRRLLQ